MSQDPDQAPRSYESGTDIYRRAGLAKITFSKLRAGRWMPSPSIYIGQQPGWDPLLIDRWLIESGRIDAHGRPCRATRTGRPRRDEQPPDWYRRPPVRYLTIREAAILLHRERRSVSHLQAENCGMRASVAIGPLAGYRIGEVVRVGLQYGWIDPAHEDDVRAHWARLDAHRSRALRTHSPSGPDETSPSVLAPSPASSSSS